MYENEVEIQSSISVRFTATYNRIPKSKCAISSAILIVLPPLSSSDHRKIRLRSRVKLSSLSLSLNKNRTTIILSIRFTLKNGSIWFGQIAMQVWSGRGEDAKGFLSSHLARVEKALWPGIRPGVGRGFPAQFG